MSTILALILCDILALASAGLPMDNSTSSYTYLSFSSPLNWVPAKLYDPPSIETFYKPYESYNASGWARYVLAECQSLNGGSCVSYSELTTGAYMTENATRIWWGIVYDASTILTLENFRRDDSENDMIGDTKVAVYDIRYHASDYYWGTHKLKRWVYGELECSRSREGSFAT
ncbi:hypothetical protein LTR28_006586 [Elasticomyces elasticus]|nr:hypothetical protein LTR28_006586 [Elasticomyces elasticus]